MNGGKQPFRHPAPLHRVYFHHKRLLIQLIGVNTSRNTTLVHAVGHVHNVADTAIGNRLKIDFDIIKLVDNGKITGRKLEIIDCQPVSFLRVPL